MDNLQIVAGNEVGIELLAEGFNRGFHDYKYGGTSFTPDEMQQRLDAQGILLADCAVLLARDRNGEVGMGIALLAMHEDCGWCGGLAVDPTLRRHGWAGRLMVAIQERAHTLGLANINLEVLVENFAAQELYTSLGYRRTRELWIWEQKGRSTSETPPKSFGNSCLLQPTSPAEILKISATWYPAAPAWQRSAHYLRHSQGQMAALSIVDEQAEPAGYVLYRPPRAEVEQQQVRIENLLIAPAQIGNQIGELLLGTLMQQYPNATFILLNEPANSPLNPLIGWAGFTVVERQYEMARSL